MNMTQKSSEYFTQVAERWDSLQSGYFTEAVRDSAIAKAYLRPEMVVADVGGGTGFLSAGLAPLVRRVYLVDGSPAMLEVARKNLSAFDNIRFEEADGLELPFPEQSLDAVFANMYLHHTPDPQAAIGEMVRVLRPGGRLVITDMDTHSYEWMKEEMADVWLGFERNQVKNWFRQAGLVNLIVDCTGQSCCAESENPTITNEQGNQAKISVFVATATRRMAMHESVQQAYAARAEAGSCGCNSAEPQAAVSMPVSQDAASLACCSSSQDNASCCGDGAEAATNFASMYSIEEISTIPAEAAEISLGCGNPTALANLKPGEVVLDIGSGGGIDAFLAAKKVGLQGRVIGVDMTPAMLERARASVQRNGIPNVEFRQGYAEALPVEDGTVDVILSNCVINLTEDKGQVFEEAFRTLKSGGRLEVSDIVTSGPVPIELRENREGWAECVTGALPEGEYLDLVSQAGFQDITTRRSPSLGQAFGVSAYSVIVSARKPDLHP